MLFGPGSSRLLALVLHLAFWMGSMVVILLSVLSGSSFVFFVGICLLGLMRFLGCTGFWILFMMAVPVMVLFMLQLLVLIVLASLGTLL